YALCEPGMAMCIVRPTNNDTAIALKDQLAELIEETAAKSLDLAHIDRIKTRSRKQFKLAMSNSKDIALKMSEAIACGDWRLFFWYQDQISKVTIDQVIAVAKKYLIKSNRTGGVFLPQKKAERVMVPAVLSLEKMFDHLLE